MSAACRTQGRFNLGIIYYTGGTRMQEGLRLLADFLEMTPTTVELRAAPFGRSYVTMFMNRSTELAAAAGL